MWNKKFRTVEKVHACAVNAVRYEHPFAIIHQTFFRGRYYIAAHDQRLSPNCKTAQEAWEQAAMWLGWTGEDV